MAVKVEALNSCADVDMLVRTRYAVMRSDILPGMDEEGGIQKLK